MLMVSDLKRNDFCQLIQNATNEIQHQMRLGIYDETKNLIQNLNPFRTLKVHEMFPEPEFKKPVQENEDDYLLRLAKEMS